MRQNSPAIFFETIHYDKINTLEKLSSKVFVTGADDGNLNVRFKCFNVY